MGNTPSAVNATYPFGGSGMGPAISITVSN